MTENSLSSDANSRRIFLTNLARLSILYMPFMSIKTASANDLHLSIVQHIKTLSKDRVSKLRILIPTGSSANVEPVAREFKALTGITIEVHEAPVDDINTQLILNIQDGDAEFDLALPATFGVPDLVAANAIIPISDYARVYEPPGFREGILYTTGNTFDDELYGYQADGDAYVMFYHRELLENPEERARYEDRFGEELKIPETWEQLDQQMGHFHRKQDGLTGGLLYRTPSYLAWEWWIRFHAKGLWPLSKTLVPQIDSEQGVLALEQMIKATEHLAPEVKTMGLFENWERYSRGDVYCNIGWGGTQKYLNSKDSPMRGRMSYGMTPGGRIDNQLHNTPYFNWGWNYVVTTKSANPELAYLFALFASTPAMSTLSVGEKDGFFDPIRREHYDNQKIIDTYSEDFLKVHQQSLTHAIPDLYLANQGEYFKALSKGLDKALSGNLKPEDALKRVAQQWQLISKRADKPKQLNRWLNLRQKYPKKIRHKLRDI